MFGRIILALVAGFLVTGAMLTVASKNFPREHMDSIALMIVGIGLIIAGIVFWFTRSLAYRKLTDDELQHGFEVHLSLTYWVMMIGLSIITLGLLGPVIWLASRHFPKRLNREGIVLRTGQQFAWGSLSQITKVQKNLSNVSVHSYWRLEFGEGQVANIAPRDLREGTGVMQYLTRILGREFA